MSDSISDNLDKLINKALEKGYLNKSKIAEQADLSVISLIFSMISKYRTTIFLMDNNYVDGINIIQRSILETRVYVKYILNQRNLFKDRGKSYFYFNKIDINKKAKRLLEINKDDMKELDSLVKEGSDDRFNNLEEQSEYFKNEYKKGFIDLEKLDSNKQINIRISNWYNLNGKINNIYQLFKYMDMEEEYISYYSFSSSEAHSTSALSKLKIDEIANNDNIVNLSTENKIFYNEVYLSLTWIIDSIDEFFAYLNLKNDTELKNMKKIIINKYAKTVKR